MNELLPVIGPLWLPSSTSGVHTPGCDHQPPSSCARCDGIAAERYWRPDHDRHHAIPPCMRKEET